MTRIMLSFVLLIFLNVSIAHAEKKVAVFLAGNDGTEISDILPPFELIAASEAFDISVLAPEKIPSPLVHSFLKDAGVRIVPDLDVNSELPIPDLIVIPFIPKISESRDQPLVEWIRNHVGPGTTVLSICTGADVLAATGLIDGKSATTNHRRMKELKKRYPKVNWIENVRYAEDGQFISSAALLAGLDASLLAIRKTAGMESAKKAAESISYPIEVAPFEYPKIDWLLAIQKILSPKKHLGIQINDGISETGLSSLIDFYASSFSGKTSAFTVKSSSVKTRYGLTLMPVSEDSGKTRFDRLIRNVNDMVGNDPIRASLNWLSYEEGGKTANQMAKSFMYPFYDGKGLKPVRRFEKP